MTAPTPTPGTGACPRCGSIVRLRNNGLTYGHDTNGRPCFGSGQPPAQHRPEAPRD